MMNRHLGTRRSRGNLIKTDSMYHSKGLSMGKAAFNETISGQDISPKHRQKKVSFIEDGPGDPTNLQQLG